MTTNYDGEIQVAKMDVDTNESFLKLKFSQEVVNSGKKFGWLKQMWAADENMIPTNSGLILEQHF